MWPDRRLLDLLGVELPIVQGADGGCDRRGDGGCGQRIGRARLAAMRDADSRDGAGPAAGDSPAHEPAGQRQFLLPPSATSRR